MRMLAESPQEAYDNLLLAIVLRQRFIKRIASGTPIWNALRPGKEALEERIVQALDRKDREAEDQATLDYMRCDVWEWWQAFGPRDLLADHYRRTLRRGEGFDTLEDQPSVTDAVTIAEAMLVDLPNTRHFDAEAESEAVSSVLAMPWLAVVGAPRDGKLHAFMERAPVNRVYFDALVHLEAQGRGNGGPTSRSLAHARVRAVVGKGRPSRKPLAVGRPVNPATILRDLQVQFVILLLRELVGIKPRGNPSGLCVVSKATEGWGEQQLPIDTLNRIWDVVPWKTEAFWSRMQKQAKAIEKRTGPHLSVIVQEISGQE